MMVFYYYKVFWLFFGYLFDGFKVNINLLILSDFVD